MEKGAASIYSSGTEFWRDLVSTSVSLEAALQTGGRYLSTQIKREQPRDEIAFCRELFAAMYEAAANTADVLKPIYPHDYRTAYENGEDALFTQSREQNVSCATRIDYLIGASQYETNFYNLELAAMRAVHDYGFDRVNMVLARNIQAHHNDGRFSAGNRQWARDTLFPAQGFEGAILNVHPILIESFTSHVRKLYEEIGAERFAHREREAGGEQPAANSPMPTEAEREFAAWMAVTEASRNHWVEDEIYRPNGRGAMYYTGGEDGIYMRISKDGTLDAGSYEGAIPHIGEAIFHSKVHRQFSDFSEAYKTAMEAGGKKFMLDMFSTDVHEGIGQAARRAYEKPSVIKQIREAQNTPQPHNPKAPRKNKTDHDL